MSCLLAASVSECHPDCHMPTLRSCSRPSRYVFLGCILCSIFHICLHRALLYTVVHCCMLPSKALSSALAVAYVSFHLPMVLPQRLSSETDFLMNIISLGLDIMLQPSANVCLRILLLIVSDEMVINLRSFSEVFKHITQMHTTTM